MLSEKSRKLKEMTRSMGIGRFVEVKFDGGRKFDVAGSEIENVKLEDSSPLQCNFQVRGWADDFPFRVEVRLCGQTFPVARCNCDEGLKSVRCEHLIKGVQMYKILSNLGIVESLIPVRPFIWIS
jgi:hypothetical protein